MSSIFRRKHFLINPKFQLTVLAYFAFLAIAIVATFYWANEYFLGKFWDLGLNAHLEENNVYFQFLKDQRMEMVKVYASVGVAVFIFISTVGLILSHRIAGSIYRIRMQLDELAASHELKEVTLRKKDFFQELADSYNGMVRSFKEKRPMAKNG